MRWSKTVRSDDWIKTSQNTMNDSSSFMSFGAEETKQKAYNNILFQWFLERLPLLNLLLQRLRI